MCEWASSAQRGEQLPSCHNFSDTRVISISEQVCRRLSRRLSPMAATIPVGCAQLAEQEQTLRHECETAGLAVPPVVGSKKRPHKVIKRKLEANITVMLRVLGRDQHVDGTRRQRAAIHLKAATLSERESRPQRDEYTLTAAADSSVVDSIAPSRARGRIVFA